MMRCLSGRMILVLPLFYWFKPFSIFNICFLLALQKQVKMFLPRGVCTYIFITIFFIAGCRKTTPPKSAVYIPGPQSMITKIGGTRLWHGVYNYNCWLCSITIDTFYTISESFAITVIDTTKFVVPFTSNTSFDTFYYAAKNDTEHTLVFNTGITNHFYNGFVIYYYLTDSIAYQTTITNPGEAWIISLNTL